MLVVLAALLDYNKCVGWFWRQGDGCHCGGNNELELPKLFMRTFVYFGSEAQ